MRIGGDLEFVRIDNVVEMGTLVDFYQMPVRPQEMYQSPDSRNTLLGRSLEPVDPIPDHYLLAQHLLYRI